MYGHDALTICLLAKNCMDGKDRSVALGTAWFRNIPPDYLLLFSLNLAVWNLGNSGKIDGTIF